MALADTANLIVNLSLTGNFARNIGGVSRSLNKFDARLNQSESRAYRFGQQIGTGIRRATALAAGGLAFLAGNVAQGLDSLIELENATAQTNAVIKSTGKAAHVSAGGVTRLAEEFEALNATVGDQFIRSAENMILTFTQIRGTAFRPTLQAVLDMNTAMGNGPEGLTKTAIQVGKALNDPATGLTALRRVGVTFSKEQVKRIKALQKEGKLYEAQKVILAELNKEFGGSFLAQGGTTAAKVAKFRDSIDDLQRTLAAGLLPVVSNVADALSKLLADPKVQADVAAFGQDLAKVFSKENIGKAAKSIGDVVNAVREAVGVIGPALGTAASVIGKVLDAFSKLPPEVQQLAVGAVVANKLTGGLVTNLAGGIAGALKNLVSGRVNVTGGVVTVNGPGVGGVPGAAGKTGIGVLGKLFLVGEAIGLIAAVNEVRDQVATSSTEQAKSISGSLDTFIAQQPSTAALTASLAGVDQGIRDLVAQNEHDPIGALLGVQGEALTELRAMRDKIRLALEAAKGSPLLEQRHGEQQAGQRPQGPGGQLREAIGKADKETRIAIDKVPPTITAGAASIVASDAETRRETTRGVTATEAVRNAAVTGLTDVATKVSGVAAPIVAAIYAARPIVNVTNVTKTTVIQQRYGPGNGSYGGGLAEGGK